jgi:hypothetical protein
MGLVNSDYLFKHHQPTDLCTQEMLCFLCGTDYLLNIIWTSLGFKDYASNTGLVPLLTVKNKGTVRLS